jgi:RNA polymerase sigma-70 factor (ECF subfamily)
MSLELLERALRGEVEAAQSLVHELFPVIRARVRRRLAGAAPDTEFEDVAQDVWVKLVANEGRELRRYDPTRGFSLANYVGLIAEREAGNHLAARRAQKRGGLMRVASLETAEEERSHPSAEKEVADKELLARLIQHLEHNLSPKGRAVFSFIYRDEQTAEEVAATMNVTPQVIYNWQHKIRTLARDFFAEVTRDVS